MTPNLTTNYLGFELASPILASASPITSQPDVLKRLEACGAAGAVLPSLFEEQVVQEEMATHSVLELFTDQSAESLSYLPSFSSYNTGPDRYLRLVEEAKRAVSMPIVGSLNGATSGGWVRYARQIEEAGADALELNIYFIPSDPFVTGRDVERRYVSLVKAVRESIRIPLAVKIGPQFSSLPNLASQLDEAGADALVLFNRYLEPEIDLETLSVEPHLTLSRSSELRLSMRWIAILYGQVECGLAATSGVHSGIEALRALSAGANVVMVTSVLLKRGADYVAQMIQDMSNWLSDHDYASLDRLIGSMSRKNCPDPSGFERANYMKALVSYLDEGAHKNVADLVGGELLDQHDGPMR
ncbi:Dihydroorotate dehydrogenase B (NAD(+)), catalytic subunit [Pirellulimonas nuda]|uniref:Dihydroorotate dehydrogenase B (NAD(+)), catalytic subunit n=1 Tax=Pirellulimonas nuda TaxID=2528009 RepID=A0A518DBW8_9BACT|nr:dihydroorotate dehydrogenase-like protein [Pirellulimonas nuda]QDU88950.1 Dihydroorotate dehydrogenase B (NAD(+)), catalytic subunit [Pirellulimonas nuda]